MLFAILCQRVEGVTKTALANKLKGSASHPWQNLDLIEFLTRDLGWKEVTNLLRTILHLSSEGVSKLAGD